MKEQPNVRHCWENGPTTEDGCGTTCMLLLGHDGPHEWTRDDRIVISFAPLKVKVPPKRKAR